MNLSEVLGDICFLRDDFHGIVCPEISLIPDVIDIFGYLRWRVFVMSQPDLTSSRALPFAHSYTNKRKYYIGVCDGPWEARPPTLENAQNQNTLLAYSSSFLTVSLPIRETPTSLDSRITQCRVLWWTAGYPAKVV